MRTMYFNFIVLVIITISILIPLRADASYQSSPFVQFLVRTVCQGQSYAYRSGCNAYFQKRIEQHKPASQSLTEGNSACDRWFSGSPAKIAECKQGCQFLNSKE